MRLIDADALIKTLGIGDMPIRLTYEINNAPTVDAVPVIRCKDCKHSKPIDSEWLECQHDKRVMKPHGFCSWAERKDNETD